MSRECVVLRYTKASEATFGSYGLIFPSVNDTLSYLDIDDFVIIEVN